MSSSRRFCDSIAIQSVVDLGCGDWNFSRLIDWSAIRYTGIDTVPEVIEADRKAFVDRGRFLCLDFIREELPEADLALVKDVLQHWPNDVIRSMMGRLRAQYRYVLITNSCYEDSSLNADIGMGVTGPSTCGGSPSDMTSTKCCASEPRATPARGETSTSS